MEFIKDDVYAAARIIGCSYQELVAALSTQIKGGISIVPLYLDVPPPQPPEGQLCRLNELGREQFPRRYGKGRVVGKGRDDPDLLRISWDLGDGRWKYPELFHKDFVEILGH
jgi:hypothetical protein